MNELITRGWSLTEILLIQKKGHTCVRDHWGLPVPAPTWKDLSSTTLLLTRKPGKLNVTHFSGPLREWQSVTMGVLFHPPRPQTLPEGGCACKVKHNAGTVTTGTCHCTNTAQMNINPHAERQRFPAASIHTRCVARNQKNRKGNQKARSRTSGETKQSLEASADTIQM